MPSIVHCINSTVSVQSLSFLPAKNFCQLLWVMRKHSCTFSMINRGRLELATSPIGRYWYKVNVPMLSNNGTFQYLGLTKVYFFLNSVYSIMCQVEGELEFQQRVYHCPMLQFAKPFKSSLLTSDKSSTISCILDFSKTFYCIFLHINGTAWVQIHQKGLQAHFSKQNKAQSPFKWQRSSPIEKPFRRSLLPLFSNALGTCFSVPATGLPQQMLQQMLHLHLYQVSSLFAWVWNWNKLWARINRLLLLAFKGWQLDAFSP